MAFFLAGGILLVKKFQLNFRYAILGLCLLFPYFFVHIADTAGGNVIQLFSIYLLMYLIDQWTRTLRWAPAIMTALVVFLGFWAKLSYVWYAPGIAILFFMSAYQYRKILSGSRIFRWQILGVIVLLASLIAILLLSESPTVPGTYPYIEALMHSERFATQPAFMEYYGYKGAIHAFFHPFDATQRIYHSYDATVLSWIYSIIMYFTLPAVLALLAWCWRKQKYVHSLAQPIIFYVAFVITIFFITSISKTGGMHHSILAYPFLILSFLSTWKVLVHHHHVLPKYLPHFLRIYVVGYVCINLLFFLIFPLQPLRAYSDPTRFLIHAITQKDDIAERYLVYLPDWGTYFYTSLFGSRKQSVVFGFFYRGDTSIAGLQKLAHQQGRKLMIVFSPLQSSPHRFLSSDLTLQSCSAIPSHAAWQILAESDPELTKMCQKYAWVTDGGKNLTRNVFVRMWLAF